MANLTQNLSQLKTIAAMDMTQAEYRSKYYYDRKLNTKHFRAGEMVYILKEPQKSKYERQYEGPYEILRVDYKQIKVELRKGDVMKVRHVDKIKRATTAKAPLPRQDDRTPQDSEQETTSLRPPDAQIGAY